MGDLECLVGVESLLHVLHFSFMKARFVQVFYKKKLVLLKKLSFSHIIVVVRSTFLIKNLQETYKFETYIILLDKSITFSWSS